MYIKVDNGVVLNELKRDCEKAYVLQEVALLPGEQIGLVVLYDSTYCADRHTHHEHSTLEITYQQHPHKVSSLNTSVVILQYIAKCYIQYMQEFIKYMYVLIVKVYTCTCITVEANKQCILIHDVQVFMCKWFIWLVSCLVIFSL